MLSFCIGARTWLRSKQRQTRPGPPSPISCLTQDLLSRVFQFVSAHWDLPDDSKRQLYARARPLQPLGRQLATRFFILSQVSATWRETAIATSELWKDVLSIPLSLDKRRQGSVIFMLEPYGFIEPDVYLDFHDSYDPYTPATIALVERCIAMIIAFTQLLLSCHILAVERLRWTSRARPYFVPHEWRLCRFCVKDNVYEVEDEVHALLHCTSNPLLTSLRTEWLGKHDVRAVMRRYIDEIAEDWEKLRELMRRPEIHATMGWYIHHVLRIFSATPLYEPSRTLFT